MWLDKMGGLTQGATPQQPASDPRPLLPPHHPLQASPPHATAKPCPPGVPKLELGRMPRIMRHVTASESGKLWRLSVGWGAIACGWCERVDCLLRAHCSRVLGYRPQDNLALDPTTVVSWSRTGRPRPWMVPTCDPQVKLSQQPMAVIFVEFCGRAPWNTQTYARSDACAGRIPT